MGIFDKKITELDKIKAIRVSLSKEELDKISEFMKHADLTNNMRANFFDETELKKIVESIMKFSETLAFMALRKKQVALYYQNKDLIK